MPSTAADGVGRIPIPTKRIPIGWLNEAFFLDASTGRVFWRSRPAEHFASAAHAFVFNRDKAGCPADDSFYPTQGYRRVRVTYNGRKITISAHRIVFALTHGYWPTRVVDHIDRCRTNNSPANLRDVSQRENCRNSSQRLTSGRTRAQA